jgi:hypothetical protein
VGYCNEDGTESFWKSDSQTNISIARKEWVTVLSRHSVDLPFWFTICSKYTHAGRMVIAKYEACPN